MVTKLKHTQGRKCVAIVCKVLMAKSIPVQACREWVKDEVGLILKRGRKRTCDAKRDCLRLNMAFQSNSRKTKVELLIQSYRTPVILLKGR